VTSKRKTIIVVLLASAGLFGLSNPTTNVDARHDGSVTSLTPQAAPPALRKQFQSSNGLEARAFMATLPLSFERNVGQMDSRAKFSARGVGYNLFLTSSGALLELLKNNSKAISQKRIESPQRQRSRSEAATTSLGLKFDGANANVVAKGIDELHGHLNYFIGNNPANWHTDVPAFRAVRYEELYPGISLTYYGNQQQLEYDFVIAPGADPQRIRMGFDSGIRLRLSSEGDLAMQLPGGELRQRKPVVYQEINGQRQSIDAAFMLAGSHQVGFTVGKYDHTKPLVIDPTLVYSTYLGGGGDDVGSSIAVDGSNNIYIAGTTSSTNFPLQGAAYGANAGLADIFVTKIDAAGANIIYSTYVGGSGQDRGDGIAIDASGNAYVVGRVDSASTNFPTTVGSFAPPIAGETLMASSSN